MVVAVLPLDGETCAPVLRAHITCVTLIVHFSANTNTASCLPFKILPVETKGFFTSSYIAHFATQETLVLAVSTIKRSPQLKVTALLSRSLHSLALRLVQLTEVKCDDHSTVQIVLRSEVVVFFILIDNFSINFKLLADALWLNNNVAHFEVNMGDL